MITPSFNNTGTGGTAQVVQENSYYGFGMVMPGSVVGLPTTPDYYQTPGRNYDAEIGRFISQDPMPESSADLSTYHYAGDNPIMMNDPSGNNASPVGNRVDIEWEQSTQTTVHEDQLNPTYNPGVGEGGGTDPFFASAEAENITEIDQYDAALRASTSIYHAGDGTDDDPMTGSLSHGINAIIGGTASFAITPLGNGLASVTGNDGSNLDGLEMVKGDAPYWASSGGIGDILSGNQGVFTAFNKQYLVTGNIYSTDFDYSDATGIVNWAVSTGGKYAFVADVNFEQVGDSWTLTTNLFYSGPSLDDLNFFIKTSLSLIAPQTDWLLNAESGFDYKEFDNTGSFDVIPAGWAWMGQTRYPISNNMPNFSLNIATSVYIYSSGGNTSGSGPAGIKVPILRTN